MLADLMDDQADKALFLSFAQSGMEGEKVLHDMLIQKYDIDIDVEPSTVWAFIYFIIPPLRRILTGIGFLSMVMRSSLKVLIRSCG